MQHKCCFWISLIPSAGFYYFDFKTTRFYVRKQMKTNKEVYSSKSVRYVCLCVHEALTRCPSSTFLLHRDACTTAPLQGVTEEGLMKS